MERKQLTREIISKDLKEIGKIHPFIIIVSLIIICGGLYEIFVNIGTKVILKIIFPVIGILFGIVSFVSVLKKDKALKSNYSIKEGFVEKVFYDNSKNVYKILITGLKGIIITSNSFSINENVYVVYYKNRALMCYSKNSFYL